MVQCTQGRAGGKAYGLLFHRRGETARIDLAELMMFGAMTDAGLAAEYREAIKATRECMRIRTQLAHCHWATLKRSQPSDGLYYVSMEKAVRGFEKVEYAWQAASLARLEEFERCIEYAGDCVMHVESTFWRKHGGPTSFAVPMREHRDPPLYFVPAPPDVVALLPTEI